MTQEHYVDDVIAYARCGWPVFPLHPGTKKPATPNGFYDATTDEAQLRQWFDGIEPPPNIGIWAGAAGLFDLDIDPDHGGLESLAALESAIGPLPPTRTHSTPGGGEHRIYLMPLGAECGPSQSAMAVEVDGEMRPLRGLDIRAGRSYMVAPPSTNGEGQWTVADDRDPVVVPEALLELATRRPTQRRGGKVGKGQRNGTAASLAGRVRRQGADVDEINEYLDEVNEKEFEPPLADSEVSRIARSIGRYEAWPKTQGDLATLWVDIHEEQFRYNHATRSWHVWDGRRWRADATEAAKRAWRQYARALRIEAAKISDKEDRQSMLRLAERADTATFANQALEMARSDERLALAGDEFDAAQWLLNVENGTIDLRTRELRPHEPADLITKLAPVVYDPVARCEALERFIRSTFPDEDVRAFVRRAIGYTITGDTRERVMFFPHGLTATGKTTFLSMLSAMLGDYAVTADFSSFLLSSHGRSPGGPSEDIARLAGARFVPSVEVADGSMLAADVIKKLTGRDRITARHLYGREFEYDPQFKLWLAANDPPKAPADDAAFWDRILAIPFEHQVHPSERDATLKDTLANDPQARSTLLRYALAGLAEWQESGLRPPAKVRAATEDWRTDVDELEDFVREKVVIDGTQRVSKSEAMRIYRKWCSERSIRPATAHALTKKLASRGVTVSADKRHYINCTVSDFVTNGSEIIFAHEQNSVIDDP